jgi:hypothetical protein
MSATTPDAPSGPSAGRRRRAQLVLVASALVVVAAAVGTSLAIATRPIQRPAAAGVPGSSAGPPAVAGQQVTRPPAEAGAEADAGATPAAAGALALDDGDHDAYITAVDAAKRRIVVDVVQVFHDAKAVKEAVADGKSPAEAQYLTTWVRNQNPRLRTLPLAGDAHVNLRGGCESPTGHELAMLAADAKAMSGSVRTFYFTLTVAGGAVQRVQERVAINAC